MGTDEVLLLCASRIGVRVCNLDPSLTSHAILGLSRTGTTHGGPIARPTRRVRSNYDPLGAQLNETRLRTKEAFDGRAAEAAHLLVQAAGKGADSQLLAYQQGLHLQLDKAASLLQEPGLETAAVDQLDTLARILSSEIARLDTLIPRLRRHSSPPSPWENAVRYQDDGEWLILRAADSVVREAQQRAGNKLDDHRIICVLGDEVSIQIDLFHRSDITPHAYRDDSPVSLISFPQRLTFRAGALPSLGHAVAHLVADLHGAGIHLCDQFDPHVGPPIDPQTLVPTNDTGWPGWSYELRHEHMESLRHSLLEVLADLLACLLLGPAYVFAMARFATGALHRLYPRGPALDVRLQTCLEFLATRRMPISFESSFLSSRPHADLTVLFEAATQMVEHPYTLTDHAQALDVQAALQAGTIVNAEPAVVLNALWEAVSRRAPYVNEAAVVLSVLNRPRR